MLAPELHQSPSMGLSPWGPGGPAPADWTLASGPLLHLGVEPKYSPWFPFSKYTGW